MIVCLNLETGRETLRVKHLVSYFMFKFYTLQVILINFSGHQI
jgi:hypothetical protein